MDSAQILTFWFGALDGEGLADAEHSQRWWRKDAVFDAEVRRRFLGTWQALTAAEPCADPRAATAAVEVRERGPAAETPEASLATVIVLDQFPRNMFRDDAKAFSSDAQALRVARAALGRGHDELLRGHLRLFLYLPFMHSEQLADQDACVALLSRFRDQAEAKLHKELDENVRFAQLHRDIIARFGRFPHRNHVLGRSSRPEEQVFLAEPGSSF